MRQPVHAGRCGDISRWPYGWPRGCSRSNCLRHLTICRQAVSPGVPSALASPLFLANSRCLSARNAAGGEFDRIAGDVESPGVQDAPQLLGYHEYPTRPPDAQAA
jgi:hypothetical protein